MKRLYLVAGESSGDLHGAMLIRALRAARPGLHCEGLGGTQMAAAGMTLDHDLAGSGIMGLAEVVRHFVPIRRLFLDTVAKLRNNPPDGLVLIDYPGFNIRLAEAVRDLRIPIVYYISPQVWAWKRKRIDTLARVVDKMLVIFPFEEALYREAGLDCAYVGHPLAGHVARYREARPAPGQDALAIGLVPGSRAQEIERHMHPMLGAARGILARYPKARFLTPCVNAARAAQVRAAAGAFPLEVREEGPVTNAMYSVLNEVRFCMVASGTATLETALFGVPMLIMYRVNPLTYFLARRLVRVDHIGIVNILMGRRAVPEFVQHEATAERMRAAALELIGDTPARTRMLADFEELRTLLGEGGASERAAEEILAAVGD